MHTVASAGLRAPSSHLPPAPRGAARLVGRGELGRGQQHRHGASWVQTEGEEMELGGRPQPESWPHAPSPVSARPDTAPLGGCWPAPSSTRPLPPSLGQQDECFLVLRPFPSSACGFECGCPARQGHGTCPSSRAVQAAVASVFGEHSWREYLIGFFSPWATLGLGGCQAPTSQVRGHLPSLHWAWGPASTADMTSRLWSSCPMAQNCTGDVRGTAR